MIISILKNKNHQDGALIVIILYVRLSKKNAS